MPEGAPCLEHTVEELVGLRVYGLALGYEDLNDHDGLRHDPVLVGKAEPREKGSNPRFVVTSLAAASWPAQAWYEKLSGARGDGRPQRGTTEALLGSHPHRLSAR